MEDAVYAHLRNTSAFEKLSRRIGVSEQKNKQVDFTSRDTEVENKQLQELLVRLPSAEKALILLIDLEEHGQAEVARLSGSSVGEVSKALDLAHERLQSELERFTISGYVRRARPSSDRASISGLASPLRSADKSQMGKTLARYHKLVDKKLLNNLSPQQSTELGKLETELQMYENYYTAEAESTVSKVHREILTGLSKLILELQTLAKRPSST